MDNEQISNLEEYLLVVDEPELLKEFYEIKSILDATRNLLFHQGGIAPAIKIMEKITEYDKRKADEKRT